MTAASPFVCPSCSGELELRLHPGDAAGAYVCQACDGWHPLEGGVADFSPPGLRDWSRWRSFWDAHGAELGLSEPPERADDSSIQREFFDSYAGDYEEIVATSPFWRAQDALAIEAWTDRLPADVDVLDLGAGTGRCTLPLAEHLAPQATIVAVDISFGVLRVAAEKLGARGLGGRVHLAVGDGMQLSFLRSSAFDVAVAYGLLHHLDRPGLAFEQLDRILRDRARILVHDNNRSALRPVFDLMMRLSPLWEAEHEGHPTITLPDLERWAAQYGFGAEVRTSAFIPPHLCDRLSPERAVKVLGATDRFCGRIPWLSRQGGIVLAEATRGMSASVLGTGELPAARR
jgi:ubiquinone/menaquinone biosynthesis C-methylase UbiE